MSSYRSRIELLHWVRTGEPDARGALTFFARLAALPLDYVEKRARGQVTPSDSDFRRIDDVWHSRPPSRHRWCLADRRNRLAWRCSRCSAIVPGERRTAELMLSRCPRGQLTAHEKEMFA